MAEEGVKTEVNEALGHLPRHIFVLRHGKDDNGGKLTEEGKVQIANIGEKCKEVMERNHYVPDDCLILSSPADKAKDSAAIISQVTDGVKVEVNDMLYPAFMNRDTDVAVGDILDLIKSVPQNIKMLIITGHAEYSTRLIKSILSNMKSNIHEPDKMGYGEGMHINTLFPQSPLQKI